LLNSTPYQGAHAYKRASLVMAFRVLQPGCNAMGLLKRVDYFGLKYARRNLKRIPDAVHSPGCDVSMPNHIVKRIADVKNCVTSGAECWRAPRLTVRQERNRQSSAGNHYSNRRQHIGEPRPSHRPWSGRPSSISTPWRSIIQASAMILTCPAPPTFRQSGGHRARPRGLTLHICDSRPATRQGSADRSANVGMHAFAAMYSKRVAPLA
jgi:hypothetical protein